MICYKDMTFCTFYKDCKHKNTCDRPLTDEVKTDAAIWWGSNNMKEKFWYNPDAVNDAPPFSIYAGKPECWEDDEE